MSSWYGFDKENELNILVTIDYHCNILNIIYRKKDKQLLDSSKR